MYIYLFSLYPGGDTMIRYKIDVLQALKNAGYSTYKIRKQNLLFESTLTKIRKNEIVNVDNLNILCKLLELQPGDILQYIPDTD